MGHFTWSLQLNFSRLGPFTGPLQLNFSRFVPETTRLKLLSCPNLYPGGTGNAPHRELVKCRRGGCGDVCTGTPVHSELKFREHGALSSEIQGIR